MPLAITTQSDCDQCRRGGDDDGDGDGDDDDDGDVADVVGEVVMRVGILMMRLKRKLS